MKQIAYIFDIDGTLADNEHRVHFITKCKPKDYKSFYRAQSDDKPIMDVILLCRALKLSHYPIILLTGRPNEYRELCEKWLKQNWIPYDMLLMRNTGDFRPDNVIKEEIYFREIEPHFTILGVFEDRKRCVDMWRKLGITCYQPKELNE